jgi:hypothetical protein
LHQCQEQRNSTGIMELKWLDTKKDVQRWWIEIANCKRLHTKWII